MWRMFKRGELYSIVLQGHLKIKKIQRKNNIFGIPNKDKMMLEKTRKENIPKCSEVKHAAESLRGIRTKEYS